VLSAFLIERSLKNTTVIGHSLYWSLKASLHSKDSFERLYLVLERFLMTSGSFKFRLYNQTLVNRALLDVSFLIQGHYSTQKGKTFNEDNEKEIMRDELEKKEAEIKMRQHLLCSLAKHDIKENVNFLNG